MRRILFVCLGNICRSPAAEGVLRARMADAGLEMLIDSAGTSGWNVGSPPYPPMQRAALARGYYLSGIRARQLHRRDFERFDLIFAMDGGNIDRIEALRPNSCTTPVYRLTDRTDGADIPDPYFNGDFDGVLDLIEAAIDAWLDDPTFTQNAQ